MQINEVPRPRDKQHLTNCPKRKPGTSSVSSDNSAVCCITPHIKNLQVLIVHFVKNDLVYNAQIYVLPQNVTYC